MRPPQSVQRLGLRDMSRARREGRPLFSIRMYNCSFRSALADSGCEAVDLCEIIITWEAYFRYHYTIRPPPPQMSHDRVAFPHFVHHRPPDVGIATTDSYSPPRRPFTRRVIRSNPSLISRSTHFITSDRPDDPQASKLKSPATGAHSSGLSRRRVARKCAAHNP